MRTAIGTSVAMAILRSELAGFRGYPASGAGEDRFARELATISLSVDHARAVAAAFDETFPTIKELRDQATNLRPKFERPEDMTKQWEAEYGAPQPVTLDFSKATGQSDQSAMWAQLKRHFTTADGFPGWAKISWLRIFEAMEQMGYQLNSEQRKQMGR